MNDETIEWYLEALRHELETLKQTKFTGHIEYQFNLKEGGIANVNCGRSRSIKKPN